ncbi:DUF2875 family protein [Stenotrophomonas rhizophila]|uniref:type VI lipase adapter Tla3 domain-containing protein n=1 Tax=Stenotrophomonas rhizophila TaxID=216778 RepID=UPI00224B0356|nr:DUF2875 family protein [Stenotrophomonas rhizophila]MCX2920136.1 DUF2875 family protein [Stenotrophomonas rhizophila]
MALFVVALVGITPACGAGRPDPTAFDRAPPPPATYDRSQLPNDFAGLSRFNHPGAPAPIALPEPPVMEPSNRLQTLDIISVGLSVEMFRQGNVWKEVQKAPDFHSNVLPAPESEHYQNADDPGVWEKRQDDTLELVLKSMVEAWPIPTVTVYRARTEELSPRLKEIHWNSIDNMRMPAGLHWTQINQLDVVYNDTPEDVVEALFRTFERYPDLPAMLVYVKGPSGQYEDGKRVSNAPIATYAAMVFARRERVEWLRPWAPYTRMGEDTIYPGFWKWAAQPPHEFKPTPFFPTPWTKGHFEQWDSLPTLARLHRPVVAALVDDEGATLKRKQQEASLAAGWKAAAQVAAPARVFFDAGKPGSGLATLSPVLTATQSELDLIDPQEGIDLSARLGEMSAASPFVGLVLATMATSESGTPSMVVPLRRKDQATFMLLTQPEEKPGADAFDVKLMPQLSEGQDMPRQAPPEPEQNRAAPVYNSPTQVADDGRALNALLDGLPGSPHEG